MTTHPIRLALISLLTVACGVAEKPPVISADTGSLTPPPAAPPAGPPVDSGATAFQPVDEADASFRAFRAQLLAALARQDTAFLLSVLAPEIKNTFGGMDSIRGFRELWRIDRPAQSAVWSKLTRVLQMGGDLQEDRFIAPYVFAFWPQSLDAFEHVAVTTADAHVRAAPDSGAAVSGTASHSILPVERVDSLWTRVKLPGGGTGWLSANDVYSPVGWRAFFQKRDGAWKLVMFVAGD